MSADEILKMIETVSPDDAVKLDEIDVRTWCWLEGYTLETLDAEYGEFTVKERDGHFDFEIGENDWVSYTRSRDALKAIRPAGYVFDMEQFFSGKVLFDFQNERNIGNTPNLPTEELAELHAIIQAIEHERAKKA